MPGRRANCSTSFSSAAEKYSTTLTSQFLDFRGNVRRATARAAGDEYVGAGSDAGLTGHGVYAAVDLQLAGGVPLVDIPADLCDLGHHVSHEFLTAEARLDRHHKNDVARLKERQHRLCARVRLDDDTRALAPGMDLFERQMNILRRVRLHMTGHEIGARVAELLHVAHRLHD